MEKLLKNINKENIMGFTHLHVHTNYSINRAVCKIEELIHTACELNMSALAITDYYNISGIYEFYNCCVMSGIKPIIGCEISIKDKVSSNLILLAKNNTGFDNMKKIISQGNFNSVEYPYVGKDTLVQYSSGIIAICPCNTGIIQTIEKNDYNELLKSIKEYMKIFRNDDFYMEYDLNGNIEYNNLLKKIRLDTGAQFVASNEVTYVLREDKAVMDTVNCINMRKNIDEYYRDNYDESEHYLKSEEEIRSICDDEFAILNTSNIANECNVTIEKFHNSLPDYNTPEGSDTFSYLQELCMEGFYRKYPDDKSGEALIRLKKELCEIKEMGFVNYFLIVWDIMMFAKLKNILTGPGRGSAAGSIVSYCLDITKIDPLKYGLIFERFLNKDRVSMPDIDIDFEIEGREEVISYLIRKYGKDKVSRIITYNNYTNGNSDKEIEKIYGIDDESQTGVYEMKKIRSIENKINGLRKGTLLHPCGLLISRDELINMVPLSMTEEGNLVAGLETSVLENLGLLKIDLLPLRTISVIRDTLKLINIDKTFDLSEINYNDKNVYAYIGEGYTEGIFQLEGEGMKKFMMKLKPENFSELMAGISLFRPGPIDFIDKYLSGRKNGKIKYSVQMLEDILSETYGCIVYQEQVMEIMKKLAGFDLSKSDRIRLYISKKKINEVINVEAEFVEGCVKNNISSEAAKKIYTEIMDFGKYAYNKSHAAAYSMITYTTAYLKYYYKREYMTALLNSYIENEVKMEKYLDTIMRSDITILPPDINKSFSYFSLEDGQVRFGLSAIRNLNKNNVDEIIKDREEHGNYLNLSDFISRVSNYKINSNMIISLVKSGVLDNLERNRKFSEEFIRENCTEKYSSLNIMGQMSLFDSDNNSLSENKDKIADYTDAEKRKMEYEYMGIEFSGLFSDKVKNLWIRFDNLRQYAEEKDYIENLIAENMGNDRLIIYVKNENMKKIYPEDKKICVSGKIVFNLIQKYGEDNVKVV